MPTPKIFTPYDFLDDFLKEAEKAKHSIYLQSMNFEAGEVLSRIEKMLLQALARGVRVNINHDWVSQIFVQGDLPLLPSGSREKKSKGKELHLRSQKIEENLRSHGATIITTNNSGSLNRFVPMVRRNHIKLYIIDENIAWMGGVNLFDEAFEKKDIMIRFEEKKIVDGLVKQFFMVNQLRSPVDYKLHLTPTEDLYVDTGKLGVSIIYKEAMRKIDSAENHIIFMSQFVPDGPLLQKLLKATKRGVKVDVITSRKKSTLFTSYPTRFTYLYFQYVLPKYPLLTLTHHVKNVHAKIITIDSECAMVGSHNYTYSGVVFGTEEIMMETADKNLVKEIENFALKSD
jgi:phosphatidylserine/phosphatidylglycerophosphate/cardiolipin synthase-like enzyme